MGFLRLAFMASFHIYKHATITTTQLILILESLLTVQRMSQMRMTAQIKSTDQCKGFKLHCRTTVPRHFHDLDSPTYHSRQAVLGRHDRHIDHETCRTFKRDPPSSSLGQNSSSRPNTLAYCSLTGDTKPRTRSSLDQDHLCRFEPIRLARCRFSVWHRSRGQGNGSGWSWGGAGSGKRCCSI